MTTLDTLLAAAIKNDRLTALTLWPAGKGWQANAKNHLGGWNCVSNADPVAALRAALAGPYAIPSTPAGKDGGVFD